MPKTLTVRRRYAFAFSTKQCNEIENLPASFRLKPANKQSRAVWMDIGHIALGKAQRIEAGNYGEDNGDGYEDGVDISAWAAELREIAGKIFDYFKPGDGKL